MAQPQPSSSSSAEDLRRRHTSTAASPAKQEQQTAPPDPSHFSDKQPTLSASDTRNGADPSVSGAAAANAFVFWAYFAGVVSLITLTFAVISKLAPLDLKGEFLAMPSVVREHFDQGRMIKVELGGAGRQSLKVFVRAEGSPDGEAVLLIHGLGGSSFLYRKMIPLLASSENFAIAVDLPGSGLSQKSIFREVHEVELGPIEAFFARCHQVYDEISEKGLLWRFEELLETGALPEVPPIKPKSEPRKLPVVWDTEGFAKVLKQVLDSFEIPAVHLVVHDTGLAIGQAFVSQYSSMVRSITIIDALPHKPSFPAVLLSIPGIGFVVSRLSFLYRILLQACCTHNLSVIDAEAYGYLLRSGSGRQAMVEMARTLNFSSDLSSSGMKQVLGQLPVQIMWANSWSYQWHEDGEQLSADFPNASKVFHQGSRWPQEDVPEEICVAINKFVSSLGRTVRPSTKKEMPEHIKRMFDEMSDLKGNLDIHGRAHHHEHGHEHGHHHHHHGEGHDHGDHHDHHGHDHGASYMGGHGMDFGGWGI